MALVRLTADTLESAFVINDTGGDGSLAYTNGEFVYTGPSASEVRAHFSVTDSGGDGSLSYDNSTGVFTYTGPSASEVRAHFSVTGDLSYDNTSGVISYTAPTAGTGVSISSGTINIGQAVGTTSNVTFNDLTVSGNLTVQGTTTTVNSTTINLADNIITLNSNATGSATQNAGIEVERGSDANVGIRWNETSNKWEFTNDGTTYSTISSFSGDYNDLTNKPTLATVATSGDYNDLTNLPTLFDGNYNSLTNLPTLATVATSGDYNDLTNLPTITTYTAGTGVTIDGSNAINIGQSVATTDSVTFAAVTVSGTVTNATDAATKQYVDDAVSGFSGSLSGLTDVSITSPTNGQVLKYNGTAWINDTDATGGGGGGGIALTDLSVTDSGGDGSLSYNNTTGVFTYTGPSATEVRAHFSAGTGISISSGVISATGGGGGGSGLTGDITTFDYGSFTQTTFNDQLDYAVNQLSDLGTFKAYNETAINAGIFTGTGDLSIYGSGSRDIELSELADNNWDSGTYVPKTTFITPLEWVVDKLNDVNFGSFSSSSATAVNLGTYNNPQVAVSNLDGFPNSALQNSSITINGTSVSLGGTRTINLADLGTVTVTTPSNGQVLKYNGTAWVNTTDQTGVSLTDFSVTDSGGDGSLSYDNSTGVFTYTGPSATEVRAHFSAGTGITISSGTISATPYLTWQIVSTATTAVAGRGYFVDTSSSAVTVTLPASATLGDTIRFNDLAGTFATNNLTVARNGHKIQGVADDLLIADNQTSFGLVYSNSTYGWKILEL